MDIFAVIYVSAISLNLLTALLTVVPAVVLQLQYSDEQSTFCMVITYVNAHAPPATVFLHLLQFQIPTHVLFIDS